MPADLLGPGGQGARGAPTEQARSTGKTKGLLKEAKKQKTKKDWMSGLGLGLAALATVASAGAASPALASAMGLGKLGAGALGWGAGASALGGGLAQLAAGRHAEKEAAAKQAVAQPPNPNARKDY